MRLHQLWCRSCGRGLWLLPVLYLAFPWLLATVWPWFRIRMGEELWVHRAGKEVALLSPCELHFWTAKFTQRIEHGAPNHEKSLTEVLTEKRGSCDQMVWILQRVSLKAGYKVWTIDICPSVHQMALVRHPHWGSWVLDPYEALRLGNTAWTCKKLKNKVDIPSLPNRFPFQERPFCYALQSVDIDWKVQAWQLFIEAYGWWFPLKLDEGFLRLFTDLPIPQV